MAGQCWEAWWSTVPSIRSLRRLEGTGIGPLSPSPARRCQIPRRCGHCAVITVDRLKAGHGARIKQGHRDTGVAAESEAGGVSAPCLRAAGSGAPCPVLTAALNAAVPGKLAVNPCDGVILPRGRKTRPLPWSGERESAFWAALERRVTDASAEHRPTTVESSGCGLTRRCGRPR